MLITSARSALTFAVVLGAFEIVAAPAASAADDAPIPVRDFFRHPERSNFRISPDGNTIDTANWSPNFTSLFNASAPALGSESDSGCRRR